MRNPRVAVTVTEEQHDLLGRLATVQGTSMSKVAGELLTAALEPMPSVLEALVAADDMRERIKVAMHLSAEEIRNHLAGEDLHELLEFLEASSVDVQNRSGDGSGSEPAGSIRAPEEAGAPGRSDPPYVTRGLGFPAESDRRGSSPCSDKAESENEDVPGPK